MPCGYDAERSREEALLYAAELRGVGARRIVAVDAAAYFSRPGPRLVDGLELMAHVLHPDLVPEARGAVFDTDLSPAAAAPRPQPLMPLPPATAIAPTMAITESTAHAA